MPGCWSIHAGVRKAKAHLELNQAEHMEGNKKVFKERGELAEGSSKIQQSSSPGGRGYMPGRGTPGVLGLALYWQDSFQEFEFLMLLGLSGFGKVSPQCTRISVGTFKQFCLTQVCLI